MPILSSTYQPPKFIPASGHFQTIFASVGRKIPVPENLLKYRISTTDGDFLDFELHTSTQKSKKLVIVSHGLEGNSHRTYILGMARVFSAQNIDVLCWNYRSCSSEMNKKTIFYHLGATYDLQIVMNKAIELGYEAISLVGFSAGGNLSLKYLGENAQNLPTQIKNAAVFSVPCHLSTAAQQMQKWQNYVYERYFLKSLANKVRKKEQMMPNFCDVSKLRHITHIRQFDEHYTAPLHNFKDAEDYYKQCSSLFFLDKIAVPTLLVNAQNDPFLSEKCFPTEIAEKSSHLFLEMPRQGGHCGFIASGSIWWAEKRALEFLT